MSVQDIDDMLELLADAIYRSVGKARVKNFDAEEIFKIYPPSRMHFNYHEMVHDGMFDELIDEMANIKAQSMAIHLVS